MTLPGRKYSSGGSSYRYGQNRQERDKELNENIYNAEFWEYDSRIVRRWNVDPKPNVALSPYNCFAGNPIWFSDPNGADSVKVNGKWSGRWRMEEGDTWSSMAKKFGASESTIRRLNTKDSYKIGDEITVEGETTIAAAYDGALAYKKQGALEVTPLLNFKMSAVYHKLQQNGSINLAVPSLNASLQVDISDNSLGRPQITFSNLASNTAANINTITELAKAFGIDMKADINASSGGNNPALTRYNQDKSLLESFYKAGKSDVFGVLSSGARSEAQSQLSMQKNTYMNIFANSLSSMNAHVSWYGWLWKKDYSDATFKGDRFIIQSTPIYIYTGIVSFQFQ
jgi:hypothetical protein